MFRGSIGSTLLRLRVQSLKRGSICIGLWPTPERAFLEPCGPSAARSENDSRSTARRSSASGSRREGRAPGTSPASAAHSPQKSSPGALAYRVRQSCVAWRSCRTIEQWAAGGMPVLPKRGAHGRPPLRSRRVSEIGRRHRHDRHPKRLTRPPSGDTGHHFGGLEGERRAGSFLGLARAKGAGSAPRRGSGGWTGTTPNPERADAKAPRSTRPTTSSYTPPELKGPRIPRKGVPTRQQWYSPSTARRSPVYPQASNVTPPPSQVFRAQFRSSAVVGYFA